MAIEGGENAGWTVTYTNIVTDWQTIGHWDGTRRSAAPEEAGGRWGDGREQSGRAARRRGIRGGGGRLGFLAPQWLNDLDAKTAHGQTQCQVGALEG